MFVRKFKVLYYFAVRVGATERNESATSGAFICNSVSLLIDALQLHTTEVESPFCV